MDARTDRGELSLVERGFARLSGAYAENKLPFFSALAAGLLAHGFAFANKLLIPDEVGSLFSKGATLESGRWGLELLRLVIPDISMPWLYGLLSLAVLAVAACLTVRLFRIQSKALQCLLPAVMLTFPSLTALFGYMFTSLPFALALLLAVLSASWGSRDTPRFWALSCLALVFSLGIYQAYVALTASFFLLCMIQRLLDKDTEAGAVLRFGLKALGCLGMALVLYYGLTVLSFRLTGSSRLGYGVEKRGILYGVALAYNAFLKTFTAGEFGFVNGRASLALHLLCLAAALVLLFQGLLRLGDGKKRGMLVLCLCLLPLSMNGFYLAAEVTAVHSVVLYSFVCCYVLAALAVEQGSGHVSRWARDGVLAALLLLALGNATFANKAYLRAHLQYESATAFYTELIAQVKQTEGFDENSRLALLGTAEAAVYEPEELDTGKLVGLNGEHLINAYTRETLIRTYLGFDVPFASQEEKAELQNREEVRAMPVYPYYGSVQKIGDYIVIKLS